MKLTVLDEGKHHLVVFKPYNMVVVAGRGAPRPTLLDLAKEQFGNKIKPVHRLDRGTVGCCILATSPYGQQALSNAFRKHLVQKFYLAVVEGRTDFKDLKVDARLKRIDNLNAKKGYLATQTIDPEGQRALTQVTTLITNDKFSVILAKPQTGRMHQIRAHLSHVGHPIIGDKQYKSSTPYISRAVGLFAWGLKFPSPEKGNRAVFADIPAEFSKFLNDNNIALKNKVLNSIKDKV